MNKLKTRLTVLLVLMMYVVVLPFAYVVIVIRVISEFIDAVIGDPFKLKDFKELWQVLKTGNPDAG